jgi:hypothetical protein
MRVIEPVSKLVAAALGKRRVGEPIGFVERAALGHLLGDEATRQRDLREAHRLFVEMGATALAEQVAKELGPNAEPTPGISSTSRSGSTASRASWKHAGPYGGGSDGTTTDVHTRRSATSAPLCSNANTRRS